jgi:hypothetical protein
MSEPTVKERLARVETLIEGLIYHQRWTMGILSALVVGVFLFALPGCAEWLGGVSETL